MFLIKMCYNQEKQLKIDKKQPKIGSMQPVTLYYEIVKENNTDEEQSEKEEDISEEKKYDEKRKIFIEKKKEKIIIRDPEHSQSKFLNGIFRLILAFIKFMAVCVAIGFMFSFIALFCLLILSFMFVKTGLVFLGSLFS